MEVFEANTEASKRNSNIKNDKSNHFSKTDLKISKRKKQKNK